jgi:cation transport ATPase
VLAGRRGVDAVAFVAMSGALLLGQNLAGIVIAIMYAGGNILEDFAARAERDLRSLIDRAPKIAHRRLASTVADVPIEQIAIGDDILVRAGEVIPVDGVITSPVAMLGEVAVTGEPIPVSRKTGELARSGSLNAGDTFEIRAFRFGKRKYLRGDCPHGERRAGRKSALRYTSRPLCAAPVTAHPGHCRRGVAVLR